MHVQNVCAEALAASVCMLQATEGSVRLLSERGHQKAMIAAPLVSSPCPVGNVGSGGGCRWLLSAIETAALASGSWGMAARSGDVAVVVSELLANALRHALPGPGPARPHRVIQLGLAQAGPCVLCAVADPSRKPPVLTYPGALDETGRGLHLVGAFSDNWGYTALGDLGKPCGPSSGQRPGQLARAPASHAEPCRPARNTPPAGSCPVATLTTSGGPSPARS